MHFIPLKKEPSNYSKINVLPLLLPHFLHLYFYSNSVSFVEGGRKSISYPRAQGILAPPLQQGHIYSLQKHSSEKASIKSRFSKSVKIN